MIQLLTSDTVGAEHLGRYVGHDWRVVEAIRAGWSVTFGPVTRVLFLQDVEAGAVPALPAPPVAPEARERQWLRMHNPHHRPTADIATFELRTYDARAGQGARFLELMLGALSIRQRHSPNFGVWSALSGNTERVLHLWGYRSLDERNQVRAGLKDDAEWNAYTATILPMLQTLNSTILAPLPHY